MRGCRTHRRTSSIARAWFTSLGTVRKNRGNLSLLLRNGDVAMYEICGTGNRASTDATCEPLDLEWLERARSSTADATNLNGDGTRLSAEHRDHAFELPVQELCHAAIRASVSLLAGPVLARHETYEHRRCRMIGREVARSLTLTLHEVERLLQSVDRVIAGVERQRAESHARKYPRILVDTFDRVQHRFQRLNAVFPLRTNVRTG